MPRSPPAGVSAAAYGGFPLDGGPPDRGDPALVNLVTTGCQLDGAAFAATILHLGARRVLALSEPEPGAAVVHADPRGRRRPGPDRL